MFAEEYPQASNISLRELADNIEMMSFLGAKQRVLLQHFTPEIIQQQEGISAEEKGKLSKWMDGFHHFNNGLSSALPSDKNKILCFDAIDKTLKGDSTKIIDFLVRNKEVQSIFVSNFTALKDLKDNWSEVRSIIKKTHRRQSHLTASVVPRVVENALHEGKPLEDLSGNTKEFYSLLTDLATSPEKISGWSRELKRKFKGYENDLDKIKVLSAALGRLDREVRDTYTESVASLSLGDFQPLKNFVESNPPIKEALDQAMSPIESLAQSYGSYSHCLGTHTPSPSAQVIAKGDGGIHAGTVHSKIANSVRNGGCFSFF